VREMTQGLKIDYKKKLEKSTDVEDPNSCKDFYLDGQQRSSHKILSLQKRIKSKDKIILLIGPLERRQKYEKAITFPSKIWPILSFLQLQVFLKAFYTKNKKFPCQLFLATALN
jgi:hypothetical protein